MEDRRAHERLDMLQEVLKDHLAGHTKFEAAIAENTKITQTIAVNTAELVALVKGAKGLRSFSVWVTPLALVLAVVYGWIRLAGK